MNERLLRPSKIDSDMWVDEAIWGHRRERQTEHT